MSSGGGNQTTTQRTEPYAPAEPFLQDILGEAQNIYRSGIGRQFFPGSTVVPFATQTQSALDLGQAAALEAAGPSQLMNLAGSTISDFASGAGQNQYLDQIRSGITSDVMGNIATQFGGMGRTGTSPMAQQAAARGITQAYAPIAAELSQAERSRQLAAAGQLSPLQQQMDARRFGGIGQLSGIGGAYEDLARRQLQDQIARFQFGQQAPMSALQQYAGLVSPIGSGFPTSLTNAPSNRPGTLGGAFGGAVAGSALPASFLGGYGTMIGAGLGGLGLI
tara:strand:+ start:12900 stop:13733 length:834 start_codon:yes stop_codon:yes gene_type:complete